MRFLHTGNNISMLLRFKVAPHALAMDKPGWKERRQENLDNIRINDENIIYLWATINFLVL